MHAFLRAIGFRDIKQREFDEIYQETKKTPDSVQEIIDSDGFHFAEIRRTVAPGIGISFRGIMDENDSFIKEYYFPYHISRRVSTDEEVELIAASDKESYLGVCDDIRVGVDLVFHVQDMLSLMKTRGQNPGTVNYGGVALSALASEGMVLLPVARQVQGAGKMNMPPEQKRELLEAARRGDNGAYEELSMSEMDILSKIARRVEKEDIYTIVRTTFMPSGYENDKYQIVADILSVDTIYNPYTAQKVYTLVLGCNGLIFEACINASDLLGEPMEGRRFKGKIWMQGQVNMAGDNP